MEQEITAVESRRSMGFKTMQGAVVFLSLCSLGLVLTPDVHADNARLNRFVMEDVWAVQKRVGCLTRVKANPKLRLAAQWHTIDVLNNRSLDADIGSDGSTVQDRARNAGYTGAVAQTVAINPALAINNLQIIQQWYYRSDYYAIMADCSNIEMGVWSENSLDRSVVVAVYGKGEN